MVHMTYQPWCVRDTRWRRWEGERFVLVFFTVRGARDALGDSEHKRPTALHQRLRCGTNRSMAERRATSRLSLCRSVASEPPPVEACR